MLQVAVPVRLHGWLICKVVCTLKNPYRDGTRACPALSGTQVAFGPVGFIAQLVALSQIL